MYHHRWVHTVDRKRAYSEHYVVPEQNTVGNVAAVTPSHRSDTDLARIDKLKTFQISNVGNNAINTGDVLARVVQALGIIGTYDQPSSSDFRTHGSIDAILDSPPSRHTDEDISSVRMSSSECQTPPTKQRLRAVSDYRAPARHLLESQHEWTWSGTNEQIKELRLMRAKMNGNNQNSLFRQAVSAPFYKSNGSNSMTTINVPEDNNASIETVAAAKEFKSEKKSFLSKFIDPIKAIAGIDFHQHNHNHTHNQHYQNHRMESSSRKPSIMHDYESTPIEARRYLDATSIGRDSKLSLRQQYINATSRGRPSIFTQDGNSPNQELLEKTTIADLIRALEVAHIEEHTPESLLFNDNTPSSPLLSAKHKQSSSRRGSSFRLGISGLADSHNQNDHYNNSHKKSAGSSRRGSTFRLGIAGLADTSHSRRGSQVLHPPSDYTEFHIATAQASLKPNTTEEGSRRQSMLSPATSTDNSNADSISVRMNKHQLGNRRASMFPADFKEFQKFTENILHDTYIKGPFGHLEPTVDVTQQRRASLLPSTHDIQEYQRQSSSRRGSIMPQTVAPIRSASLQPHNTDTSAKTDVKKEGDLPELTHRRSSGRVSGHHHHAGTLGILPTGQRRHSLRPSPLAKKELPKDTAHPLEDRRSSQPMHSGSARFTKSVFFGHHKKIKIPNVHDEETK